MANSKLRSNRHVEESAAVRSPCGVIKIRRMICSEVVPEEGPVEILAPTGSDKALDERMRARYERNGLEFLDVENSQIRSPAMKAELRIMIGTEALGKWLTAAGLVEHAADAGAVDMCRFDTESNVRA